MYRPDLLAKIDYQRAKLSLLANNIYHVIYRGLALQSLNLK